MIVLVCGGRDYSNQPLLKEILDSLTVDLLVHGGCPKGADMLASRWARTNGIPEACYDAQWYAYGRSAGPKRNSWMLKFSKPDLVVAFSGGRGTADTVKKAKAMGILVREVK